MGNPCTRILILSASAALLIGGAAAARQPFSAAASQSPPVRVAPSSFDLSAFDGEKYRFTQVAPYGSAGGFSVVYRAAPSGFSATTTDSRSGSAPVEIKLGSNLEPVGGDAPRGHRSPAAALVVAISLAARGTGNYLLAEGGPVPAENAPPANLRSRPPATLVSVTDSFLARIPGRTASARIVRISHNGEYISELLVGLDGSPYAFAPDMNDPRRYVLEPPASGDENGAPRADRRTDTGLVTAQVLAFIEASGRNGDEERLRELVDWGNALRRRRAEDPSYARLKDDVLIGILLKPYLLAPPVTPELLAATRRTVRIRFEGDAATATLGGGRQIFRLRRSDSGWRITDIP